MACPWCLAAHALCAGLTRSDFLRLRLLQLVDGTKPGGSGGLEHWPGVRVGDPQVMHTVSGLSMYGTPDSDKVIQHLDTHQKDCNFFNQYL